MRLLHPLLLAARALPYAPRALFPRRRRLDQRLRQLPTRGLPIERPVTIRWNNHGVPFIEAERDGDLAFALGLVHAHLREGQLALAKRLACGRIAEMIGPRGRDIDHTLRIIGLPDAAPAVEAAMPEETRAWVQAFADGLNWYQDHVRAMPPEYGLLGLRRERWMVRDLLAIGRLAGVDINWMTYFGLIGSRASPAWPAIWRRTLKAGNGGAWSFGADDRRAAVIGALAAYSRSGSNCVVVAPERSATGGALLASDPHLPLLLPNLWVLAGVRSPSFNVVGLMPAGLPIFGLGRNPHMAWGGTNMRAAVSDLFDVGGEPLATRTERIRSRLGRTREVSVRRSSFGPVVSDSPLFHSRPGETIALRWMGHDPSDEITAFIRVARAETPDAFRSALATYAVSPQNMQFADRRGNIGQVMATWLPRRGYQRPPDMVLGARDPALGWDGYATVLDLPFALNPPAGFLASANNPPTESPTPVGFIFITSERVQRLQAILGAKPELTVDDLRALQRDVISPASHALNEGLLRFIDEAGLGEEASELAALRAWDGGYGVSAREPVLFETLLHHVVEGLRRTDEERPRPDWNQIVSFLLTDLAALEPATRANLLRAALAAAMRDAARFPTWGDMHVMRAQSVLANIPLIGRRFRVDEYPVSGSRETVMKSFHGLVRDRHPAVYGSQARFIADMADPDGTEAVLFGGQDGWLGSVNFADQLPLFKAGEYIRLPLTPDAVARAFPITQQLQPAP